jgi:hypothetical protein
MAEFMVEHRQEQRARMLTETPSHKASTPATSAKVAHCYRDYRGECDPVTWFGSNTRAGRLVTELYGVRDSDDSDLKSRAAIQRLEVPRPIHPFLVQLGNPCQGLLWSALSDLRTSARNTCSSQIADSPSVAKSTSLFRLLVNLRLFQAYCVVGVVSPFPTTYLIDRENIRQQRPKTEANHP